MLEIQTIANAMTVLGLFSAAEPELGVTDIARRLNMSKSTVARILYTLELSGVLLFIEDKQKYRLGYKVVEMSSIFLNTCTIRKVALPYMRELRKKIDETIDLSVLHRNKRILIERSHGYYDVIQRDIPGKPTMLHASASGKLFLAYMPVQERDRIIDDMDLVKFTSKTITNREELRLNLDIIRSQGFSCSSEELTELINGVAAPIKDKSGQVTAAISIWGMSTRFSRETMMEYSALLISIAERISSDLGYLS